jgi:hypothetical protein
MINGGGSIDFDAYVPTWIKRMTRGGKGASPPISVKREHGNVEKAHVIVGIYRNGIHLQASHVALKCGW